MMTQRARVAVALSVATVACWVGWMGWDRHRDHDPVTGASTGPYEAWQVVGCVLCLVVLAGVATRWLATASVVSIMSVVFTAAWSASAASDESVGANLWPLGGAMIFAGMVLGTAVVAMPARVARRRGTSPDR